MRIKKGIELVNIIGVSFVIVAIVAAGGLYYTSSTYSKISDTLTNCNAQITNVNVTYSNTSGEYSFLTTIYFNNTSELDIEIMSRFVEYSIYSYKAETYSLDFAHFIGPGRGIQGNGTVLANADASFHSLTKVKEESPYYGVLENSIVDGTTFVVLSGFVIFNIVDYPDVTKKLPINYAWPVSVHEY